LKQSGYGISPEGFQLPSQFTQDVGNVIESDLFEALAEYDFVYVTRFQTERMTKAKIKKFSYTETLGEIFLILYYVSKIIHSNEEFCCREKPS